MCGFMRRRVLIRGRCLERVVLMATCLASMTGCLSPGYPLTSHEYAVAEAARPILAMDPDAVWTESYNRLVELGPASLDYLFRQPVMTRPAAPDDLSLLLHTSLIRLLIDRSASPPRLHMTGLETALGLVHLDLKVLGRRVGTVAWFEPEPPRGWHELYPLDFDHGLAANVDLEADREALERWWRIQRGRGARIGMARPLEPRCEDLWRLLARRLADVWDYMPEPRAVLCSGSPPAPALIRLPTYDYNLVRAACVWLGSRGGGEVPTRLIELIGSASPVVAHNARFALRYSPDERIRRLLRRYDGDKAGGTSEDGG